MICFMPQGLGWLQNNFQTTITLGKNAKTLIRWLIVAFGQRWAARRKFDDFVQ